MLGFVIFVFNNPNLQALLQARLGAYSSESEDGDKGIKNRRPCMKKSVETINLIDDDDSEEDIKNKNLERYNNFIIAKIYVIKFYSY